MRRRATIDIPPRPNLETERTFWARGQNHLVGLDEAGRGALAGPVAVGAVILPAQPEISERLRGVRDSKQMTPRQRQHWAQIIRAEALACAVGMASAAEIDALGIAAAIRLAGVRALRQLVPPPDAILADYGIRLASPLPAIALIKGDQRSLSIAAASVLAKTVRDDLLIRLEARYPGYGLAQNKGYGTRAHRTAIQTLGFSAIHRRSFGKQTG